jgi:hypothetical protein
MEAGILRQLPRSMGLTEMGSINRDGCLMPTASVNRGGSADRINRDLLMEVVSLLASVKFSRVVELGRKGERGRRRG